MSEAKDLFSQRIARQLEGEDVRGTYECQDHFKRKLKVTIVDYAEFSHMEHVPPATWFVKDASGMFIYIHTSKRGVAQMFIDAEYGANRYTVNASKMQKGTGTVTCTGTSTRRGQKR